MSDYTFLKKLTEIDSPTGYTHKAGEYIFDQLKALGWNPVFTNKGAVKCALGQDPTLSIAAHHDTIGAIVSGFKTDGNLRFSTLGGLSLNMAEGAYCNIHTMDGKIYTGTMLLDNPSVHVNHETKTKQRSTGNVHIRLDEKVEKKKDTLGLGIQIGDIIAFEPNFRELASGFIKSRFLDNKAGCYIMYELARKLKEQERTAPVELFFSNYEEVGHGASSGYSAGIREMLVIDMGVIGDDQNGSESACSICAKDSSGPYDYHFRKKLVQLAEANSIPYRLDVYPFYGSDGSAALRAGQEFRVGLIGPGVAASHGVERTHKKGIQATIDLCLAYIDNMD